tara:strand:+ start:4254 stop:4448 length:195 start_codon:yes stop_codon:yes gene_type:complete
MVPFDDIEPMKLRTCEAGSGGGVRHCEGLNKVSRSKMGNKKRLRKIRKPLIIKVEPPVGIEPTT